MHGDNKQFDILNETQFIDCKSSIKLLHCSVRPKGQVPITVDFTLPLSLKDGAGANHWRLYLIFVSIKRGGLVINEID